LQSAIKLESRIFQFILTSFAKVSFSS